MNILSEITNDFNLSMILVTHNRKADDPDPLNMISGSTGLVGASDGVFVLEKDTRTGNRAKLTISNRDTEGYIFILEFDSKTCYWKFIEEETETNTEESLFIFLNELMSEKTFWSGTATELCEKFAENNSKEYVPATITKKLKTGQQFLKKEYNIKCYFKTEKNTKLIKIYREKEENE